MKKLLFIYHQCNSGGVQTAFKNRMRALINKGYTCKIIFHHSGTGLQNYYDIPYVVCNDPEAIKSMIIQEKYDLIDFINDLPGIKFFIELKFPGVVLFEVRGLRGYNRPITANIIEKYIDGIIVPSSFIYYSIMNKIKPNKPIFILPNIVDTKIFRSLSKEKCKQMIDVTINKNNKIILGWVGRLGKNKNWRLFLCILKGLTMINGFNWEGWVISDLSQSPDTRQFREALEGLHLHNHIRVFDSVPHELMPVFYTEMASSGGLLLSTSHSEGYQNAIIEAMACGCPVISTKSGGNLDIIQHGYNGYLFDIGNFQEALSYAHTITTDMHTRTNIIKRAQEKMLKENNEIIIGDKFVQICDRLFLNKRGK